jgi:hypothetical protein
LPSSVHRPPPDCEHIYNQLRSYRNINLTLTQLWLEYKAEHPGGYQYTQFCEYYRRWRDRLDYCMRQEHRAGEKVFVDYCDGLYIVDPVTGELIPTQLFVAVWSASTHGSVRRMRQSRRELFQAVGSPHALPLPQRPYEYAEWRKATVNIDYHIEVDGHYYSVPFRLLRQL